MGEKQEKFTFKEVVNKKTGEIAELQTGSFMGPVIWLVPFDRIPKGTLAVYPWVIYSDDKRFKDWKEL